MTRGTTSLPPTTENLENCAREIGTHRFHADADELSEIRRKIFRVTQAEKIHRAFTRYDKRKKVLTVMVEKIQEKS